MLVVNKSQLHLFFLVKVNMTRKIDTGVQHDFNIR